MSMMTSHRKTFHVTGPLCGKPRLPVDCFKTGPVMRALMFGLMLTNGWIYSISQEICTRFLLCCALLWLYIDFPISIRLTSLALWQSNDCPSASKATLMNMNKYFLWIHYEQLHNHNKAKHNKTVCTFLGIYCTVEMSVISDALGFIVTSL